MNSSNNRPTKTSERKRMKNYLLSEQDIDEIYWAFELFVFTVLEKLSEKEIKDEE